MKRSLPILTLLMLMSAGTPPFSLALGEKPALQSQETSAAGADQAAKSAPEKGGTTLIGCLSGPDSDGKFTLHSMSHRTGVEVFGPENLKDDAGSKVKLTGSWKKGEQPSAKGKESRTFQATDIEVLAQKCEAPSEKTPVSKGKQQKQQQKQKSEANAGGDAANPK
jgi:hypothetical protein